MPIACGAALAAQLEDAGKVTACFFGDGATGEGEFHETLNIASLWKLPLLFVCENNRYGAGNAVESVRAQADITLHAPAYGMPGISVDGNDVLAVRDTAAEAAERARRGDGPTLIHCKTFRSRCATCRRRRRGRTTCSPRGAAVIVIRSPASRTI